MISLPVEFTFAAEVEALQAFLWYETIKKGLGEDFIYKDIRSAKIKTFPYNLIYRVFNAKIQIIAVFHHSRNPREWKKRI